MGNSGGAGNARGDDPGGGGAGAAVFVGAVRLRSVSVVCGDSHAVREEGEGAAGAERDFSVRQQTPAGYARLPGRAFLCAERRKVLCDSAVYCATGDRDYGCYPGDRFDSGDFWDYAGCVYRVHVKRVCDFGIAGDVFFAGGSAESIAVSNGGIVVCAGVYRSEDAGAALGGHSRAHFADCCGRNFAGGTGRFATFSCQDTRVNGRFTRPRTLVRRCNTRTSLRRVRWILQWDAWSRESAWWRVCFSRSRNSRRGRRFRKDAGVPKCRPFSSIPRNRVLWALGCESGRCVCRLRPWWS